MTESREALTAEGLAEDPEVRTYIEKADTLLEQIGYTEHGMRHTKVVSHGAGSVLEGLGAPPRRCELARIAGLLHDVGNFMGRHGHTLSGAIIAFELLSRREMAADEVADICTSIAHHETLDLVPTLDIAAALTLADKADVHYTRVRAKADFDIHDRINDAAKSSFLRVVADARKIDLEIVIDTSKGSVMEYFEIFLERMIMCRTAANHLGCDFGLYINETRLQ